ncbi:MAG: hypothetical protein B7Z14_19615 [Bosea sp. 32-68-6]|nr:MAG: hypothetical protein B7Z14_19615 [Bosea sp. 32-68-6]
MKSIRTKIIVVMDARGIYMSKDAAAAEPFAKGMEARFPQMRSLAAELTRTAPESERAQTRAIEKAIADFITFRTETIRLAREVSTAAANTQGNNEANRNNRKALNDLLVAFAKTTEAASTALQKEAMSFTQMAQTGLPIVLGVTLLGSLLTAMFFAQRSLTRPILDLSGVMEALTRGDLKVAVPHLGRQDEIGTMAKAVSVLRESSEQVAILQQQEQAAAAARLARERCRAGRGGGRRGRFLGAAADRPCRRADAEARRRHQRDQRRGRRRHQRVLRGAAGDRGR